MSFKIINTSIFKNKRVFITIFLILIFGFSTIYLGIYYLIVSNDQKIENPPDFLEYLKYVPDEVHTFTYFNLDTIKQYANESIIKGMYFIEDNVNIDGSIAIIMSSNGKFIFYENKTVYHKGDFINRTENSLYNKIKTSVYSLYGLEHKFDVFGYVNDSASSREGDVYLNVDIKDGLGIGKAVFDEQPLIEKYQLLEVAGVKYKSENYTNGHYYVYYDINIQKHLEGGLLMDFKHTRYCTEFFLGGGIMTQEIEEALRATIRGYSQISFNLGLEFLNQNINSRNLSNSPILVNYTYKNTTSRIGNIAPYGIILKLLKLGEKNYTSLTNYLQNSQTYNLWAYHDGYLPTSLDSTLIFEGIFNQSSINHTKIFMTNNGGFLAQLNDTESSYSMDSNPKNEFWCQEDYGTTASCYYYLNIINESNITSLNFLKDNFDNRSSMWIANPFFIDYLTARALINHTGTDTLCQKLISDILIQRNHDGTWGGYDVEISTAFAILALDILNYTGYEIDYAKYQLINLQNITGFWNGSVPYFWALCMNDTQSSPKDLYVNGKYYQYSLCDDIENLLTTSYVLLALSNFEFPLYGKSLSDEQKGANFESIQNYLSYILNIYDIY